jgi:hypothetical protein
LRPAVPPRRKISEVLALLPKDSTAVMDADVGQDIETAIERHRAHGGALSDHQIV